MRCTRLPSPSSFVVAAKTSARLRSEQSFVQWPTPQFLPSPSKNGELLSLKTSWISSRLPMPPISEESRISASSSSMPLGSRAAAGEWSGGWLRSCMRCWMPTPTTNRGTRGTGFEPVQCGKDRPSRPADIVSGIQPLTEVGGRADRQLRSQNQEVLVAGDEDRGTAGRQGQPVVVAGIPRRPWPSYRVERRCRAPTEELNECSSFVSADPRSQLVICEGAGQFVKQPLGHDQLEVPSQPPDDQSRRRSGWCKQAGDQYVGVENRSHSLMASRPGGVLGLDRQRSGVGFIQAAFLPQPLE